MSYRHLLLATAACTITMPAFANDIPDAAPLSADSTDSSGVPVKTKKTFNTGVAKGRDLLDSAISASTLDETDLPKLGTTAIVGILGNLPGIRAESTGIDGSSALTVRGLPLTDVGSKYMQI